jgi:hypothetical protein
MELFTGPSTSFSMRWEILTSDYGENDPKQCIRSSIAESAGSVFNG